MIRVILLGRTGNHLFQYALGRVLSQRHGVPLVLDGSWYNRKWWRSVEPLLRLPLQAEVVRRLPLASRALLRVTGKHYWEYLPGVPVIKEDTAKQAYDERIAGAPADCVLFGYYQSWRYFEGIADEFREELTLMLGGVVELTGEELSRLGGEKTVAVHVRRTDYLEKPELRVCDEAYYRAAIDQMRDEVVRARFLVYSDDPQWCRERLAANDVEVMDAGEPGKNPLYDLRRMSMARHHIIANSSYSWWAAWLAERSGHKVLAPARWFNGDIDAPMDDKLLPGWGQVKCGNAENLKS